MKLRNSVACLLGLLFLSACSDDHPVVGYHPHPVNAGYIARPVTVSYPTAYPVSYPTYAPYPVRYLPYASIDGCTRYPSPYFYSAYATYPFWWRWRTSWSHWIDPYRLKCNFKQGQADFYEEILDRVSFNHAVTQAESNQGTAQLHDLTIDSAQMICDDRTYEAQIAHRLLPRPGLKVDWSEAADGTLALKGHRATPLTGELDDEAFELGDVFEDEGDSLALKVAERVTGVVTDSGTSGLSEMGIKVASTKDPEYQANCLLTSVHVLNRLAR